MLLSFVMPVFNEKPTLHEIIRRVQAAELGDIERELVLIDDFSTDGSREMVLALEGKTSLTDEARPFDRPIRVFTHEVNQGKGAALRTGFRGTSGELVCVQDADLEYDPNDYARLLDPVFKGKARVVYGSRFTGERKNMFFHHWIGNKLLTLMANILFNTTLSDMETCYKLFPGDLIRSMEIESKRFSVEPEITAKVLKAGYRIYEVPISYCGREFDEGKKISWRDGFSAIWALFLYRFIKR